MAKPPVVASLTWEGDLRFLATSGTQTLTIDGESRAGASPVQTLAFSIAGCMAIDVVAILRKGRHAVTSVDAQLIADRAETEPHRFVSLYLKFLVRGDVPPQAVERAITLSREKYCSVSNTLKDDIEFTTAFEVLP